jgi:hypothetical protein
MSAAGLYRAIAILLALASCTAETGDFYIANKGQQDIHDLTVTAAGATWRLGDLPRGATIRFSRHIDGEGGPLISWSIGRRRVARQGCYYTGGMPLRGSMVIVDERVIYHCR